MIGEAASLGAALIWACAVVLLRLAGQSVPPFALNLYRVVVSSIVFVPLLVVLDVPLFPERSVTVYATLFASGLLAIAISDTLLHRSINMVGAGINAIVDTLYSPFMTLTALVILSETVNAWQIAGMLLVISGVLITTKARPPGGTTRRTLLVGIAWGVLAMATLAIGIVIAKPVLETSSILWVTTMRQLAALSVLAPVAVLSPDRRRIWSVFRPARSWRFVLPATLCGSVLALLLWITGIKHTEVGIAAVLNQTSTVFILVLASLVLGEPFTARRWLAAGLAVAGILMVTLGG